MPAVGQYSVNQTATGSHDLTRYLNKAHQETFELHQQDVAPCRRSYCYQAVPGLQIPGQGCNNHISPIRNQSIRRHPQCIHPALELTDDVFLVAAVIGEQNYFLRSHLAVVGDIEKIPNILEQPSLSPFDRKVFPNHNHPVGLLAVGRTIVEFGDMFAFQPNFVELSFFNYLFLNIFWSPPLFSLHVVAQRPLQPLPAPLRQAKPVWSKNSARL
jgi:hypothetical protein